MSRSDRGARGVTFALLALYLGQGLLAGAWAAVLLPAMQGGGVGLADAAGVLAWGGVPWVLKIGAAPLIDRWMSPRSGRLRMWALVALQLSLAAVSLAFPDPGTPATLAVLGRVWLLANALMALQDVITDAASIDLVPEHRRGRVRSLMLLAASIGSGLVGATALGRLTRTVGVDALGPALAVVFLGIAAAVFASRRAWDTHDSLRSLSDGRAASPGRPSVHRRDEAPSELRAPRHLGALLLALLLVLGNGIVTAVAGYYLLGDLEWTVQRYQELLLPFTTAVTLLTYVIVSARLDRIGAARGVVSGAILSATAWLGLALSGALAREAPWLLTLATFEAAGLALLLAALHAWLMELASGPHRAIYFAVAMGAINLGQMVLGPLAGARCHAIVGSRGTIIAAAVTQITLVAVWRIRGRARHRSRST